MIRLLKWPLWLLSVLCVCVSSLVIANDRKTITVDPYPSLQAFPRAWIQPDGASMPLDALLEESCLKAGITYVAGTNSPLTGLSAVFDGKPILLADLIHRIEGVTEYFAVYRGDVLKLQPSMTFRIAAPWDKRTESFLRRLGATEIRSADTGILATLDHSALQRLQSSSAELAKLSDEVIAATQPVFEVVEGQDIATILHGWAVQQSPRWYVNYEAERNFIVQTPNQFHAKNMIEAVQVFFDSLPSSIGLRAEVGRDNRVIIVKQEGRP